jgi:tetratricopeptide (TPR) repeat protein
LKGRREGFEKEMAAVAQIQKEIKIDPFFLSLVGRTYARAGRTEEAFLQLKELESRLGDLLAASGLTRSNQSDQAALHLLKGEVELAEKKYEEAVNSFHLAAGLGRSNVEENLAFAFLQKGDLDKAIESYLEFLKAEPLGYEPQESWILAHFELGKLYLQQGRPDEARKYFERFLDIWKDADPDLAPLIDARKRLALLNDSR